MADYLGWTDERVERLKADWKSGLSCSLIAKRLGGITRNAVIGKVHRLGLSGRSSRMARRSRESIKRTNNDPCNRSLIKRGLKPKKFRDFLLPVLVVPPPRIDDVARVTLHALEAHHCRWPVGDPGSPEFGYCGCQRAPGLSYCRSHAARAYAAPTVKRRQPQGAFRLSPRLTIAREDA